MMGRGLWRSRAASVFCLLVFGSGGRLFAGPPNPAHWSVEGLPKRPLTSGETFRLTLAARIEPGWHIYAMEEPDGGPIPTQIGLAEGDALALLAVDEPRPRMVPDRVLREPTGMFENVAGFTLRLRAPQKPPPAGSVSHILIRYQSCNDQVCLPPHTETVALPLAGLLR
jgi:DsbC/DsbD-like thiol-disulfide interchange protein